MQDNRKNALKTDFVITCQKSVTQGQILINYHSRGQDLSNKISEYLRCFAEGVETYQVLNHFFISNIPTGKIYRVSRILKALEHNSVYTQGRWYLKT
jgi:hypothetical protein